MSNAAGYLVADPLLAAAWHCRESTYEYGIQDNTGALQGAFGPGCWRWWGTVILPVNEWSHTAVGVDGPNEMHFVNGAFAEQDGCAGSLTINNDDFKIGARGGDGTHGSQFRGSVDEAMLFGAMLSEEDVQAIYDGTFAAPPPPVSADIVGGLPASLVGYWPLDGDATELSSNSLEGTVTNGEWVQSPYGLAFHLFGEDGIRVADGGASPLDVDNVLMLAWLRPSVRDVPADRGIIMNK